MSPTPSAVTVPSPWTQEGRVSLYSRHRRWICLPCDDSTEGASAKTTDCRDATAASVTALMAQLCEFLYHQGWATGTGGGVSIKVVADEDHTKMSQIMTAEELAKESRSKPAPQPTPARIFVAPSGIQKEDMVGVDMFEMDAEGNIVKPGRLKPSACTPLWYVVYRNRPTARCVIHTHSMNAVMATLLDETASTLKITHLEMLKGVGGHAYDDVLEIPIIDNRPTEDQLADQLEEAVVNYPLCNAVLVRRHGLYVWGDSWQQAKTCCESFDYVLDCAIRMKRDYRIDPAALPAGNATYRVNGTNGNKRKRVEEADEGADASGFRGLVGSSAVDQTASGTSSIAGNIPLLPRDSRILLLDIEGCTTSISFVHDELFPYARQHVREFVAQHYQDPIPHQQLQAALFKDMEEAVKQHASSSSAGSKQLTRPYFSEETPVVDIVFWLMDHDVKSAALKDLQGLMWQSGYESGELKGHVYSDVPPMLAWMKEQEVKVYIYSSGSIKAQKLLFGNSVSGNLLPQLSGHFDITTAGNKKRADSYRAIAKELAVPPSSIVFISDLDAELEAATEAGIGVVQSVRPGNAPVGGNGYPLVHSLLQLCGEV